MSTPQLLRHLHLPGITPFTHTQTIQTRLVTQFLTHKALLSSPNVPSHPPPSPTPTLLTFVPTPVYTTGRRELGTLTPAQITHLQSPLPTLNPQSQSQTFQHASVTQALRGGQITFHGPGQLVLYPILDLKSISSSIWPKGLTARCYIHLLESTTIRTLAHFGIQGIRTENPGVWLDEQRKIAALGVHLRRNVTSYGVGINISTDMRWFERIVACGLVGKEMSSFVEEEKMEKEKGLSRREREMVSEGLKRRRKDGSVKPAKVANVWAKLFAEGLWGGEEDVSRIKGEELLEGLVDEEAEVLDGRIAWRDVPH